MKTSFLSLTQSSPPLPNEGSKERSEGCLSSLTSLHLLPWYEIEEERQGQTVFPRKSPLTGPLLLIKFVLLGGDSTPGPWEVPCGPLRDSAASLGWLPASSHANTSLPHTSVALRRSAPHNLIYSRPGNTGGIQLPYQVQDLNLTMQPWHTPHWLYSLPSLPRAPRPSLGTPWLLN